MGRQIYDQALPKVSARSSTGKTKCSSVQFHTAVVSSDNSAVVSEHCGRDHKFGLRAERSRPKQLHLLTVRWVFRSSSYFFFLGSCCINHCRVPTPLSKLCQALSAGSPARLCPIHMYPRFHSTTLLHMFAFPRKRSLPLLELQVFRLAGRCV